MALPAKRFNVEMAMLMRAARAGAGITQAQVGELLGISKSAVSHAESGRWSPQLFWLARYAEAVGVEPRDLVPPIPRDADGYPDLFA